MRIVTDLTGTKPLLMHNIQLANPENSWAKQIAAITAKRKKTEDDRRAISNLEWHGSLYVHQDTIGLPTGNVLKSFIESAKVTKAGKNVARALSPIETWVPLLYKGPEDIKELAKQEEFRDMTLVGIGKRRVLRTRPIFRVWAVSVEWELVTEVLDYDDLVAIVKQAGVIEGLGDNRVNGYGRYDVDVRAQAAARKAA